VENRYYRRNRRKYNLKAHIVLATKYRKPLLQGVISDDVKQVIYDVCNAHSWGIIAMETDKDHIHLLICYDTTTSVSHIGEVSTATIHHYIETQG
jgi:putative transposase